MTLYTVETYPDATFSTDPQAQQEITERAMTKGRWLPRLFGGMITVFVTSAVSGFLGFPALTVVGIVTMGALTVAGMAALLWLPSRGCPECGTKMQRDWAIIRGGRSAEFLLCCSCRIALCTHRLLR